MAKSQQTFSKKEKEKKRLKKKKEKLERIEERRSVAKTSKLEDMLAYVDENGNITETPPDPSKKKKFKAENIEIAIPKREEVEMPAVRNGRVDFFDDTKGFGFIIEHETNERFFVHVKGLIDEIREGDKVSFELEQGLKGLNAVLVKKL